MAACRMNDIFNQHTPVLLHEAISHLITSSDGIYIDATFGRGSHSQAILQSLSAKGRLIAFDKDPEAIVYAHSHFKDERFSIFHHSFADMHTVLKNTGLIEKISGILFDLGVSSPQLDNPNRGFSFMRDGQLDMRMDTSHGMDAASWIAKVDEATLADVLWQYGEERHSRRIARAIIEARKISPITKTLELAAIIAKILPAHPHEKHPATRSFQAIRIFINQELIELKQALNHSVDALKVGGRLAVISFHSLEDRIVKQFIHLHEQGPSLPRGLPIKHQTFKAKLKAIGKPITADDEEIAHNPRARSAILRISEKTS